MSTNFEEAVNELKLLKTIDDDTVLDISEKYNLSILEVDKLYTVATEQMIVGKSGYCGFDQKKICDIQCEYFYSCTRKNNTIEDGKPGDSVGEIIDSFGYVSLGRSKKKLVYANNKGSYLYVDSNNKKRIYIHPKYNTVLDEKDFSKKIVVGDDMPEFPEQESGYLGTVYHGLCIDIKDEGQLKLLLDLLAEVKVDYSEKNRANKKKNIVERPKRATSKHSYSDTIDKIQVSDNKSNKKRRSNLSREYSFEDEVLSIDESTKTRAGSFEADADKDVSAIMTSLGLTYVCTEHRCNHYVLDDPYMDVYYISKEKLLAFHPNEEDCIDKLGLNYKKITNYYLREFPSQVTGYGDSIYFGIGIKVWDKEAIEKTMLQILRRKRDNTPVVSAEDNKKTNLLTKSNEIDTEINATYNAEHQEKWNCEIEEDKAYQELLLEEYKKWLKKEGFLERIIDKHEKAIHEMEGLNVLGITDYKQLLEKIEDYCRVNKPSVFIRTVFKYYTQFYEKKSNEELNESEENKKQEEAKLEELNITASNNCGNDITGTYRDTYYEGFLEYLKERTDKERDRIGKKGYSYGSLKTMATNAFYLEKHSKEDFIGWFGSYERLENARQRLIELFNGKRGLPEVYAKYYIEVMRYLNDYLTSIDVVVLNSEGLEHVDTSTASLKKTTSHVESKGICIEDSVIEVSNSSSRNNTNRFSYSEVYEAVAKKRCDKISKLIFEPAQISDKQNADLWAKALVCDDIEFIKELDEKMPVRDVDTVIESLKKESIVTLCGISPNVVELFELSNETDLLSKLIKWAEKEFKKDRKYIEQTMITLAREFERKIYDTAKGRIDPDGYSVDPDYDSAFDVNYDNGIALKKVMEYDRAFIKSIKKAKSNDLLKAMIKEGFDVSRCKPGYVNTILLRRCKFGGRGFDFSEQEKACLDLVLANGYDVNKMDACGFTLLRYAIRAGNIDATKYLLEHGADPSICIMTIHQAYANKLIKKGMPQDLFVEEGNNTVRYLGKDGILFQPAFSGNKELLELLMPVVGGSPYYSLFLEIINDATLIFYDPLVDIRAKWMGKKYINEYAKEYHRF